MTFHCIENSVLNEMVTIFPFLIYFGPGRMSGVICSPDWP